MLPQQYVEVIVGNSSGHIRSNCWTLVSNLNRYLALLCRMSLTLWGLSGFKSSGNTGISIPVTCWYRKLSECHLLKKLFLISLHINMTFESNLFKFDHLSALCKVCWHYYLPQYMHMYLFISAVLHFHVFTVSSQSCC